MEQAEIAGLSPVGIHAATFFRRQAAGGSCRPEYRCGTEADRRPAPSTISRRFGRRKLPGYSGNGRRTPCGIWSGPSRKSRCGVIMIVKKIRNTKAEKPKAWQIGDLVDYIRFPHNRNPREKIEYADGRGFFQQHIPVRKVENDCSGKGSRFTATCRCSTGCFPGREGTAHQGTGGEWWTCFWKKWG